MPDRKSRRMAGRRSVLVGLQAGERLLVEDLADQPESLVQGELRSIRYGDPGRLLATMLEGMQPERHQVGDRQPGSVDADNAALLARPMRLVDRQLVWQRAGVWSSLGFGSRQGGPSHRDQRARRDRGTWG